MPTLLRVLIVVGVLTGLVVGAMTAMVTYMKPDQRDISQTVTLPNRK